MSAASLLREFLGSDAEEVVQYVLGTIAEAQSSDMDKEEIIDEISELLAAHALSDTPPESEELRLIAERVLSADEPCAEPVTVALAPSVLLPVTDHSNTSSRQPPKGTLKDTHRSGGVTVSTSMRRGPDSCTCPGPSEAMSSSQPVNNEAVLALRELLPEASPELCSFVLDRCAGSRSEAAELLFSTPIADLENEMHAATKRVAAAAAASRAAEAVMKKRQVGRYAEVSMAAPGTVPPKLAPPRLPYSGSRKDTMKEKVVRYRDNQVMTYKGNVEKYSVDQKEEFDGGSRGKVKTKGKRGPGFVMG